MADQIYYAPNGVEIPLSAIEEEARANNITIEEVISNNNYTTEKPIPEFEIKLKKDPLEEIKKIPKDIGKIDRKEDDVRVEEKPLDDKKTVVRPDGSRITVNKDVNLTDATFNDQLLNKIDRLSPGEEFQYANNFSETESDFVDNYYDGVKLAKAGVNKDDFAGWLQTSGRYKQLKIDIDKGLYKANTNVYNDLKENALFENDLATLLDEYAAYRDEKRNFKIELDELAKRNQTDFTKFKTLDAETDNLGLTKVTEFGDDYFSYKDEHFKNLAEFNKQQREKLLKRVNSLEKRTDVEDGIAAAGNTLGGIGVGAFEQTRNFLIEMGDMFGADDWAKKQRKLISFSDANRPGTKLDYTYFDGKSLEIDGVEWGLEDDGSIYNLTHGYRANEVLDPMRYKYLAGKVNEEGVESTDWNGRGGSKQLGNVVGGVLFQVAGAYATGGATSLVGKVGLKSGQLLSRADLIPGLAMAGKSLKISKKTQGLIGNTLFQSGYGALNGKEATLKAAYDAGLTDEEAENLAGIASQKMAVLYAATSFINPRLPAMKALDDAVTNANLYKRVIDSYNGTKSYAAANTTLNKILKEIKPTSKGTVTFIGEGGKETIQENIQQAGEYLWVNKKVNAIANQKLLKDEYTEKDIKVTSALSFATGGLVSRGGTLNNLSYNNNSIIDLYTVGQNIKSAENRFNDAVEAGKITRKKADQILTDAKNVNEAYKNNNIPSYIMNIDPDAYVKIAGLQSEINKLENKQKNNKQALKDPRIAKRIEKLENDIVKAAETANRTVIRQDVKIAEQFAKIKVYKNAKEAAADGITELDSETEGLFFQNVIFI